MRDFLFVVLAFAALCVYGRWANPPRDYAVVVPIERDPPIRVVVVEPVLRAPADPGPVMDVGVAP